MAVFEHALDAIAPAHAAEVAEQLPSLCAGTSPHERHLKDTFPLEP